MTFRQLLIQFYVFRQYGCVKLYKITETVQRTRSVSQSRISRGVRLIKWPHGLG